MARPVPAIFRTPKAQLAALTLGHFLVDMYAGLVQPLIPELRDRLDVKVAVMAIVIGASQIVVNAIQPVAGLVSARLHRPVLLMLGPALAMTLALLGFANSLAGVAALVIGAHVGIGMFHPDGLMTAHRVSGAKGHLGVPFFLSGGYLGFSLGALISTQWVHHFGFSGFWLLSVPGIALLGLFVLTGLHAVDPRAAERDSFALEGTGPNLWALLALSVLTVMMTCVVYMFLCVDLDDRWGADGRVYGGVVLAVFGICGAGASYVWGHLSARYSRFALIALGHAACVPLFLGFGRADSVAALIGWSIPLGMCMGSALFPVIATAAREAPQLNPNLRAGIIMGGTWGCGSIFTMSVGQLMNFGIRPAQFLPYMVIPTILAAALGVYLYTVERKNL